MTNIRNNPPCRTCTERYEACHDKCENFLSWRAALNEINDTERLARGHKADADSVHYAKRRRMMKWLGSKARGGGQQ